MRNTTFFLAPMESKHRKLVVIDMAYSRNREWTARLVIKTDLVEKRSPKDPYYKSTCDFHMAAFDADVGIEFSINNFESKSAKELKKWRCIYPISPVLKESIEGFISPNRLARHLKSRIFTSEIIYAFQNDMDDFRTIRTGRMGRVFERKREHFINAIKKHFGDYLDIEQLSME
jgi:hypothetical protein